MKIIKYGEGVFHRNICFVCKKEEHLWITARISAAGSYCLFLKLQEDALVND